MSQMYHEPLTYLDFDLEIGQSDGHLYSVTVRSHAGQARQTVTFPFTNAELETHLLKVENAILRSVGNTRKNLSPDESAVQQFGQKLFDFLLTGELLSLYRECQREADHQGKGMRLRLQLQTPLLATLPWEFLHDARKRDYVCLDPNTPLVRYAELAHTGPPLRVTPPLRVLGMVVASTNNKQPLDVADEKARVMTALQPLQQHGLVEVTWLVGQTAPDLQRTLRRGPWHIFHFIGHGGFDPTRDEGLLLLEDEQGQAEPLYATQLARLLAMQRASLRLVLLNSCEGARASQQDLLSSTAATLIGSGIPAVLAMQYAITDGAAVQFARTFYEALADNLPVDAAVADARNAILLRNRLSLEWGTPVLHMRAPDGVLFAVGEKERQGEGETARLSLDVSSAERSSKSGRQGEGEPQAQPTLESEHIVEPPVAKVPAEMRRVEKPAAPALVYLPTTIPFDWVTIPVGKFLMGSAKQKDPLAEDRELPQHKLYLPEYRIARLPVTVTQFEQFVKATHYKTTAELEGSAHVYNGSEWEDVKGSDWVHPRGPHSDVKQKGSHPVTCISWHDALAFCQWAQVRLPTEAEWEKAARGPGGRIYPWGDKAPDKLRCNFNGNEGDTTPVDRYPKGVSQYAVWDMAGNVWEWTSTKWRKDYNNYARQVDNGLEGDGRRVARGGSWFNSHDVVRCACRRSADPSVRYLRLGFRVVAPGS